MGTKRSQQRQETIEKLLDASIELLRENGYAKFRIAEVGKRAGLSEGLVFKYFETKVDLVVAAFAKQVDSIIELVQAVPVLFPSPPSRKELVEAAKDLAFDPNLRWAYELLPASAHDEQLREKVGPVVKDYYDRLERSSARLAIQDGQLPSHDAIVLMRIVTFCLHGAAMADMATGPSGREHSIIAYLLSFAEAVYGPENAPTHRSLEVQP